MDLFTTVARLPYSILGHHRNDTVIADRLNYKYTVILFVIFSIVVSNKQFGSEQIVCWSPGHFVQNYVNYVNQASRFIININFIWPRFFYRHWFQVYGGIIHNFLSTIQEEFRHQCKIPTWSRGTFTIWLSFLSIF